MYRARRLHASPQTWVADLKRASVARGRLSSGTKGLFSQ